MHNSFHSDKESSFRHTVCVISLGCPKNRVDSEHILGLLGRSGFTITAVPRLAEQIVINTCGFLQSAVSEAEQVIRRCLKYKAEGRVRRVVVVGCLVQRWAGSSCRRIPEVDAWVGIDDIPNLPRILTQDPVVHRHFSLKSPVLHWRATIPRLLSTPSHYAYLRIADGCDNHCSYCLIPTIRGRFRSRPVGDILCEARALTRSGVRELILVAQDTTLYGCDMYGKSQLSTLLRQLAAITGVEWLRLLYTHPAHYTPELIDELALNAKIVKYVDLPLQHISNRVLKRMNRPYQRCDIETLLRRLQSIPGMSIRTTFITGFPGETERDFQELLDFVAAGHFRHVGCFPYSPEPGTPAARYSHHLPLDVREERAIRLMATQRRIVRSYHRTLVGKILPIRIDTLGKHHNEFVGRTSGDAPEIDNTVHVRGDSIRLGDVVTARITRATPYTLYAVKS